MIEIEDFKLLEGKYIQADYILKKPELKKDLNVKYWMFNCKLGEGQYSGLPFPSSEYIIGICMDLPKVESGESNGKNYWINNKLLTVINVYDTAEELYKNLEDYLDMQSEKIKNM